jgi:hypothetical protein
LLFVGCETRSISNSDYKPRSRYSPNAYAGELSEVELLGIDRNAQITERDIASALDSAAKVKLRKGSRVLLVQSGAQFPDEPMVAGLSQGVGVVPFTGNPQVLAKTNLHQSLRLSAARGGCETVVCYWGVLECARQSLDSKAVSWVPIVGSVVPDEHQYMRIRLKIAVVDVRTGCWSMFSPEPFEDKALSARLGRERSDQAQVNKLKQQAYASASRALLQAYGE